MAHAHEIIERHLHDAADGNRHALDQLLEALQPQVHLMVAARLAATPAQFHAVEEIAQVSMIALVSALARLEHRTVAGLHAFLSRIVSNKVADFLRRRAASGDGPQRPVSLDASTAGLSCPGPLWHALSADGVTPGSHAAMVDDAGRVLAAIGELTERARDVITLAFFDQLSTAEIATRLDISRPAAAMLLLRSIRQLRRRVTGSSRLDDEPDQPTGDNGTVVP
ncbi:MAG: sigma-70 family RNA polymerase sigma factor [Phycisphaerales bacterium]|nr:sigma-70 family RNA polymerase sigma factor [Phycisphaerales bacterium]